LNANVTARFLILHAAVPEPPTMRNAGLPKWALITTAIVGVVVLLTGKDFLEGFRKGLRDANGGTASQQQPSVPGYGPAANYDPRAANGPAAMQPSPMTPTNVSDYPAPTASSNYPPANAPNYEPSNSPNYPSPNAPNYGPPNSPNYPTPNAYREPSTGGQAYRDPQGRFAISVPDGWRATASNRGVVVAAGSAYAMVAPFDGAASSEQVVGTLGQQYASQWRNLQIVNRGPTPVSGVRGEYVVYQGINPNGVPALLRIAGAASGGQAWAIVISAPLQEFNRLSPTLQQIEMSFAVGNR
jgi:hypothetical protein